jgi:hypothetical protein
MTALSAPALVSTVDGSFTVTFKGSDNVRVVGYQIQVKRGVQGTWSAPTIQVGTSRTYSGLAPGTWYIDVRARDAAGNLSAWKQVHVVVPTDDRAYRFSVRMTRKTSSAYLRHTLTTTYTAGSRMTVTFRGNAFYLIGATGVSYGRIRITIDGVSYTVDEGYSAGHRATSSHYRVTVFSRSLTLRAHTVTITCLATTGRRTIAVDAVGWRN